MKTRKKNRLLALLLCLCMMIGILPLSGTAYAAEPCPNHPAHDAACGYIEAVEGHACGHTHDEACGYAEAKEGALCKHEHDTACGYVAAVEGHACGHTCELCNGAEKVMLLGETQEATYSISGRVKEDGYGTILISGITATLWKDSEKVGEATTDDQGNFTFTSLIPGTYTVKVGGWASNGEYYTEHNENVTVEDGDISGWFSLKRGNIPDTYSISGSVQEAGTQGADGALGSIGVTLWNEGNQIRTVNTDIYGDYTFSSLSPGRYTVKVGGWASNGVYYIEQSQIVTIIDSNERYYFNLEPGNLPGTYSISGDVGAEIIIGVTLWKDGQKVGEATTNSRGDYTIFSIAPGTYTVKTGGGVSGGVYYSEKSQVVIITDKNENCWFHLQADNLPGTYSISGDVGAEIIIGVTLLQGDTQVGVVSTNKRGEYIFYSLANGEYTVKAGGGVSGNLYYAEQSKNVMIANANQRCKLSLVGGNVPGTYSISGKVSQAGSSDAIADIPVELWQNGIRVGVNKTVVGISGNPSATYNFMSIAPGAYTLRIPAGTYGGIYYQECARTFTLGDFSLDITLTQEPGTAPISYTVSGKVQNAAGGGLQGIPVQLLYADIKLKETTTGADGGYTFTQVNDGEYTLRVPAGTYGGTVYQAATKSITMNGQNVTAANLTLSVATNPPSAPGNFTVTPGFRQAVLSWTAPDDDGGSPVIKYQYSATTNGAENWQDIPGSNASTTSYTVTGLTGGTEYTFKVRAVSGVGAGAAATATATPTVPGPSAPLNFDISYANTILILRWKAPASDGGLPIIKYQYSVTKGGEPDNWQDIPGSNASTTTYTVTGLTNFTNYTVKLRAVNSTSIGEAVSDTFYLEPSRPGAVRNLTAIPGDGQMTLTWEKPENDGGSPITRYQYRYNEDPNSVGGLNWVRIPDSGPNTVSFTVTGLENGKELAFWVRAVNDYGTSDAARVMGTPLAPATAPTAPQNFKATPGDKQVALSWEAPASDGGAEITGYEVSKDNGTSWAAATSATGHTFDNLTNGQSYTFQVRAVNGAGKGATATATVTPQAATYILTVENGTDVTSSGPYSAGERVTIRANAPADGKLFDRWTTSGGGSFASVTSAETIFTMPAGNATVTATYKNDETAPTGEIKVNNNSWRQFLNAITFNLFFKETQEVTITANDNSGQGVAISYYKADAGLTLEQVEALTDSAWTAYTGKIRIAPDDKLVIYARLTDKAGNVSYISSDGMVLDATPPVIQGAEHGKTYTEAKTITVSDDYLKEVTVGSEVKTIKDNACTFTLDSNGTYTITAVDKAGNTTEITVTIEIPVVISPNLTGITAPAAITGVTNGTALADIQLPDQVEITTTEGNKQADVTWNRDTATYDPASKAAQTFTISGDVTLPGGVTNTGNIPLSVQISITVAAEDANVITDIQIASMANKTTYTEGDALDLTGLTVKLTFSKSGEKTVPLADFGANHITVSPVNGAKLTMSDTTVTVSAGGKSTSFTITIKIKQQVQPLAFSPVAGTYDSAQSVEITCGTTGAKIYYTTDGSIPTTTSTLYTDPITVDSTKTIKAVAIKGGMKNSAVASATYTIETTLPHTHSYTGGWLSDGGGHWKVCNVCGEPGPKTAHSGGTATCHTYAVCTVCGASYGAFNPAIHDGGTEIRNQKPATETEEGYTGDEYCLGCGDLLNQGTTIPKLDPVTYSLTIQAGPGGQITKGDSDNYEAGKTIDIEARANKNYTFDGWTASGGGSFVDKDSASTTFTMPAGAATITANFRYTGSYDPGPGPDPGPDKPAYTDQTLGHKDSGVRVSGSFTDDAVLEIRETLQHAEGECGVCDDIRARQDKGELIVFIDISLLSGSYTGDLTVEIPVGEEYNGQMVIMIHCKDKTVESRTLTVENGVVRGTFSNLSPFAVVETTKAESIKLTPSRLTLELGESEQLKATVSPEDTYDKKVNWKSSNRKIVNVSDSGKVEAIKAGTAIITCTAADGSGAKATCKVTVRNTDTPLLVTKATAGKNRIRLNWNEISNADGYEIYGSRCGKGYDYKKIKTITKGSTKTWTHTKLRSATTYKYYVKAYKLVNGRKLYLRVSKTCHVVTTGGRYTNIKSVTATFTDITLGKGRTRQISAHVIPVKKGGKLANHVAKFRYKSTNSKVATVTASGKIKAVGKGKCSVYVYANNGVTRRIMITVK